MSPSVYWSRALIAILAWMACSFAIADNNTAKVDFNRDIRTILSNKCFNCHGPDENERQASLRLDTQAGAWAQTESDAFPVVPGKPQSSELIRRIISTDSDEKMPPEDSGKTLTTK